MADERKPIGYLMGYPIYADEALAPGEFYLKPLSNEDAKRAVEQMAAESIADKLVRESPREAM